MESARSADEIHKISGKFKVIVKIDSSLPLNDGADHYNALILPPQ